MALSKEQSQRYKRNIIIPDIGQRGQEKLLDAQVLVVGLGGLGSSCAYYLAAAGVGKIGLVDFDKVEIDNLQRQILHTTDDLGRLKVESAKEKLKKLNPAINVVTYEERFSSNNGFEIAKDYDLFIECSDNYSTKYLVNDIAIKVNKPFFYAAVIRFEGQAITVFPGSSACLRCTFSCFPSVNEVISPRDAGILGAVAGTMGLIQTNEVLKYILGIGKNLANKLLIFDALDMSIKKMKTKQDIQELDKTIDVLI